jgi:hypothetical protein
MKGRYSYRRHGYRSLPRSSTTFPQYASICHSFPEPTSIYHLHTQIDVMSLKIKLSITQSFITQSLFRFSHRRMTAHSSTSKLSQQSCGACRAGEFMVTFPLGLSSSLTTRATDGALEPHSSACLTVRRRFFLSRCYCDKMRIC